MAAWARKLEGLPRNPRGAYLWAPMRLTGPVNKPKEDLFAEAHRGTAGTRGRRRREEYAAGEALKTGQDAVKGALRSAAAANEVIWNFVSKSDFEWSHTRSVIETGAGESASLRDSEFVSPNPINPGARVAFPGAAFHHTPHDTAEEIALAGFAPNVITVIT